MEPRTSSTPTAPGHLHEVRLGRRFDDHGARTPQTRGRLLVVEEYSMLAEGLGLALAGRGWTVETSSGPTADDVVDRAHRFEPDCILTDVRMGVGIGCGIELVERLAETNARVVMLTAERRRSVLAECVEAGATGWISKGSALAEVDAGLMRLLAGESLICLTDRAQLLDDLRVERERTRNDRQVFDNLTEREALVLAALSDGLSAAEIADEHVVGLATVRSQIRGVLLKLDVRSQLAAVAIAAEHRHLLPQRGDEPRDRRRPTGHRGEGGIDRGLGPDFAAISA